MSRINKVSLQTVDLMPTHLKGGVLYVSEKYRTAVHLCCCGCGSKVVTPLKPGGWQLKITKDERATLYPSIGNWSFPCQSHYWIRGGEIEWAPVWSKEEIDAGRARDRKEREAYYDVELSLWERIKRWFGRVFGR